MSASHAKPRLPALTVASSLAVCLAEGAKYWTFAAGRTLEAGAHLRQFESQFRHGAAQRIAVHPQLFGRLALVSPVLDQHFAEVLSLELAHRFLVGNAAGVHLRYQAVQFSSHVHLLNLQYLDLIVKPFIVYIKFSRPAGASIQAHVVPS